MQHKASKIRFNFCPASNDLLMLSRCCYRLTTQILLASRYIILCTIFKWDPYVQDDKTNKVEGFFVITLFFITSFSLGLFFPPFNLDLIQPLEDFNPEFNAPLANYAFSFVLNDVITGQCQVTFRQRAGCLGNPYR